MRVLSSICSLFGLLALTSSATAQDFQFQIVQGASNYTWSGTTSLGPLLGNPNNTFQLNGTMLLDLDSGGNPVGGGEWISSDALVVPDLSGRIPNPLPFLPDLAVIDVVGMRFSMASNPFAVTGTGAFSTTSTLTITSGILTVTPITGSPTVTDLTGTQGPPSATTGTITEAGGLLTLNSPMNTSFTFTDPASGISATLNLVGTLKARFSCPSVNTYCVASPNSVGAGAQISTTGSTSITNNDLGLVVTQAPAGKPGLFFFGPNQIQFPFGDGFRCVGGSIKRMGVVISSGAGVFQKTLNQTSLPGGATIDAGQTVNFQCWYRDPSFGTAGFNLSNAASVFFCP